MIHWFNRVSNHSYSVKDLNWLTQFACLRILTKIVRNIVQNSWSLPYLSRILICTGRILLCQCTQSLGCICAYTHSRITSHALLRKYYRQEKLEFKSFTELSLFSERRQSSGRSMNPAMENYLLQGNSLKLYIEWNYQ